jgi:hypothetical protein
MPVNCALCTVVKNREPTDAALQPPFVGTERKDDPIESQVSSSGGSRTTVGAGRISLASRASGRMYKNGSWCTCLRSYPWIGRMVMGVAKSGIAVRQDS